MAKRKRLTPADPAFLGGVPENEGGPALGISPIRPHPSVPIADVAAESAASAALNEVSEKLRLARQEGRMMLELPLDAVKADYLVRDRQSVSKDETEALVSSLRARGQQTPIEVMEIGEGRYGLISGWRRLTALRQLHRDEGGPDIVLALLRRPEQAADAYQAMVEENEIRVGLSYFERARIAAKAVEQGVFETEKKALLSLFASVSRAKRSKIRSFLTIVDQLDGTLRFPEALGERVGLDLAKALGEDSALADRLRVALNEEAPQSAAAEQAILKKFQNQTLSHHLDTSRVKQEVAGVPSNDRVDVQEFSHGFRLEFHANNSVNISGDGMSEEFRSSLRAFVAEWK